MNVLQTEILKCDPQNFQQICSSPPKRERRKHFNTQVQTILVHAAIDHEDVRWRGYQRSSSGMCWAGNTEVLSRIWHRVKNSTEQARLKWGEGHCLKKICCRRSGGNRTTSSPCSSFAERTLTTGMSIGSNHLQRPNHDRPEPQKFDADELTSSGANTRITHLQRNERTLGNSRPKHFWSTIMTPELEINWNGG